MIAAPSAAIALIDLSHAAAAQLEMVEGVRPVRLELITDQPDQMVEMVPMTPMTPMEPAAPAANSFVNEAPAPTAPAKAALLLLLPPRRPPPSPSQGRCDPGQDDPGACQRLAGAGGGHGQGDDPALWRAVPGGGARRRLPRPARARGQRQAGPLLEQIRQGGLEQAFIVP